VEHRFRTYEAIFTVVGKRLPFRQTAAFFYQVAPGVVGVFLITPLLEPVVFQMVLKLMRLAVSGLVPVSSKSLYAIPSLSLMDPSSTSPPIFASNDVTNEQA
uniref:hypothetical protein n=1 Tax=Pseudomonas viridiflava TaxID=33069 RepID=UPI003C12C66D